MNTARTLPELVDASLTPVHSIFRYAGSKARAVKVIQQHLPLGGFSEYRDAFTGGGSMLFNVPPGRKRWANDRSHGLMAVYRAVQCDPEGFRQRMLALRSPDPQVLRDRYYTLRGDDAYPDLAARYYFLNRLGLNGWTRFSPQWRHRTSPSNPTGLNILNGDRIATASRILQGVRLTCGDFAPLFAQPADPDGLTFGDPPYWRDTDAPPSAKHYDHAFTPADHHRLADAVHGCKHRVLLTYDDDPRVWAMYPRRRFWIHRVSWRYGGVKGRPMGHELIVTNYRVPTAAQRAAALVKPVDGRTR